MPKIFDNPLSASLASNSYVQAKGIGGSGASFPDGIPGRIDIIGGATRFHLNITDPDTAVGKRTETTFATFPNGTGEYWSVCDFKYDWDHTGYVVIGSWYATPDAGDATKYVPLGFRIRNGSFLVQVPLTLPGETLSNKVIAEVPINRNQWYQLCAHANLQPDSTGFREVFLDGIPIVREYNIPTTYNDVVGPYFKMGPYDGNYTALFTEVTMYVRNVTMWTGNDGYRAVMGRLPAQQTRYLQL